MQISISNSIGNIGGTPPHPEFTRYIISDCVFSGDYYNTLEYEWGTFNINDRVVFNKSGGILTFGKINSYTTEIGDDINPSPVGVNSANCFNNTLSFSSSVYINDTTMSVDFNLVPLYGNFVYNADIENDLIYDYYISVYYEGFTDEDEPTSGVVTFVGQFTKGNYNFIQNQSSLLYQVYENTGDTITFYAKDSPSYEQPSFGATTSFSNNGGCSQNYFLQNTTGYTYVADFYTEC